jgi:signal transduction histidine kinase
MNNFFNFSFKNRIAFNYLLSGALLIALVFLFILQTVKFAVNQHVNEEVKEELVKHLDDVTTDDNDTYLIQVDQWRAREHNSISVNPVFVEFYDNNKKLIDKSPNLKSEDLILQNPDKNNVFINSTLNAIPIRQIQTPILNNNNVVGFVVVAMSLEDFEIVDILKNILLISYPIILVVLFLFARFFAGKSIQPVSSIIDISSKITRDNLSERIPLPTNKDELFYLSETINSLLNRIENAIEREKQFTSHASHELRTPLAVVKGTMEVLIRKPRNESEYKEKIAFCISEINRLNYLIDQLLLLARFENQKQNNKQEHVFLNGLVFDSLIRYSDAIQEKKIKVSTNFDKDFYVTSDHYLLTIIIDNLISNAIKYNQQNGQLIISLIKRENNILFTLKDSGVGISSEHLEKIFNPFYRSHTTNYPQIKGTGLGLSIVKRLCDMLQIDIVVKSEWQFGTEFILSIPLAKLK